MEDQERLTKALPDRYRIEREIGVGGMATVYLAQDLKHDRKVAIKVLDPELAQTLGAERFLREIKTAANLTHPHILPLFDSGEADGFLYYVMPFIRGESLRARLTKEKQLPVEDALQITHEIADALAFAHGEGIIHRDVKPANIMLEAGHAVLADFGVAHAVAEAKDERLTRTGTSLGTPSYMSPEQATGDKELDGRSDQYALGCVLYEMLAGHPPFTGAHVEAVVRQHLTADPPSLKHVRAAVPAEVAAALTRALAKSPADRYRTTLEFAGALVAGGPSKQARFGPGERKTSSRVIVGIAGLTTAVVLSLLLWIALKHSDPATDAVTSRRVIVLPYDNQTGNPDLDPIGRMVAEWITEGLARTGEVQVVPNLMVLESLAQLQAEKEEPGGETRMRRLAAGTDAGIAVTGTYYRHGEEIEFHSEVVDLGSGAPLGAVKQVRGLITNPGEAIDLVRGQVMGVLATRLNPRSAWEVPASVQPPNYDAFQLYQRGGELWIQGRYREAAEWFTRAYENDTTFLRSLLIAAAAHGNGGDPHKMDSLLQVILPRRGELAPYDRHRLDYGIAGQEGDIPARLRAARAAVQLVPSGTLRLGLVQSLIDSNRPREALESLEIVWVEVQAINPDWHPLWSIYTEILHLLGNHDRELEIARQGKDLAPTSLHLLAYEGRALAALGRSEEVRDVVNEILAAPEEPGTSVGAALSVLTDELRAHGHLDECSELLAAAMSWLQRQSREYSSGPEGRELQGRLLYQSERWEEAGEVFRSLGDDGPPAPAVLGSQGVVATRLGDSASALSFSRELAAIEGRYEPGMSTLWQARVEAILGNKEEAMALLRQAFGEGVGFGIWAHRDMDLESLRGFPPFEEFMKPKG